MDKKVCISLIVKGESAKELIAVGEKDFINYFLPERLNIKKEDLENYIFEEI